METMLKVGAVAVAAALCAVAVKGTARQLALALSLTGAAVILGLALGALEDVVAMAEDLREMAGLSPAVVAPVLKTVGIAVLTQIASQVCRDAGEGGIAAAAETAGTALALCAALPLLRAVLDTVGALL
nr:SpoIIIAC/SpoIIIAD family protein [uncultured Flavonifractor sp.]